jgi:hypothetical protein
MFTIVGVVLIDEITRFTVFAFFLPFFVVVPTNSTFFADGSVTRCILSSPTHSAIRFTETTDLVVVQTTVARCAVVWCQLTIFRAVSSSRATFAGFFRGHSGSIPITTPRTLETQRFTQFTIVKTSGAIFAIAHTGFVLICSGWAL